MKRGRVNVCIVGDNRAKESDKFYTGLAQKINENYQVVNFEDGKLEMGNPEHLLAADVLVPRLNTHDDSTWFLIGLARAAGIPIVPIWYEQSDYTGGYGFTKDVELRNKALVRPEGDNRHWPSKTVHNLIKDLDKIGQQNFTRNERPSSVDFSLPVYLMGDARNLENIDAFYNIQRGFEEAGIKVINPARDLDNYSREDFPQYVVGDKQKMAGINVDAIQWCADAAGKNNSAVVGRAKDYGLMGMSWEIGYAWFNKRPVFYINQYVFGNRGPQADYKAGRCDPFVPYINGVFRQNEQMYGIQVSEGRTPLDIVPELMRLRG